MLGKASEVVQAGALIHACLEKDQWGRPRDEPREEPMEDWRLAGEAGDAAASQNHTSFDAPDHHLILSVAKGVQD